MQIRLANYLKILALSISFLTVLSCGGGGGGGGDFQGAGNVSLRVSPNRIDIGDRMLIEIEVDSVNSDGVFIIARYDVGLSYVPDTAFLEVDNDTADIGPAFQLADDDSIYLVFIFTADSFGDRARGTLSFQLAGDEKITNGEIAVDMDVDDPQIDNAEEFSVDDTRFQTEDQVQVTVEG